MPEAAGPQSLARHVLDRLPDLMNGVTLRAWQAAHPSDSLVLYGPRTAEQRNENWCVRTIATLAIDSARSAVRTAYFYPPKPPDPLILPTASLSEELRTECRLGFIWTEAVEPDSQRAVKLGEETRQAISAALHPADTVTKASWWGSYYWRQAAIWRPSGVVILSAITNGQRWREPDPGPSAPTRLLAIASGPASGLRLERTDASGGPTDSQPVSTARRINIGWIGEMVALAEIGGELEQRLRSDLAMISGPSSWPSPAERQSLAMTVAEWVRASGALPSTRRAAALVAADRMLDWPDHSGHFAQKGDSAMRRTLEVQGARYDYSPLGTVSIYTNTWLRRALEIDPAGRAGQIAFLVLMQKGFDTSATCADQKGEGFRVVIARGLERLQSHPSSSIDAEVHFLVARAYADIVRLAHGGTYHESDSTAYLVEEPEARARAVEHYVAGFARGGASSPIARDAWAEAWRLMAGLTPQRTFFYCVYD
jgi:hypothetical protein